MLLSGTCMYINCVFEKVDVIFVKKNTGVYYIRYLYTVTKYFATLLSLSVVLYFVLLTKTFIYLYYCIYLTVYILLYIYLYYYYIFVYMFKVILRYLSFRKVSLHYNMRVHCNIRRCCKKYPWELSANRDGRLCKIHRIY